jgi:hypothetical protein
MINAAMIGKNLENIKKVRRFPKKFRPRWQLSDGDSCLAQFYCDWPAPEASTLFKN